MQSIFSNALSRAVAKHIDLSVTRRDVVVADDADHAAWNNLPVAAGGVCGKRGADRFGAPAILPVLSVRPARQHVNRVEFGPLNKRRQFLVGVD